MREAPLIIVIMGVAGSGKTTVGSQLARDLGWAFHDADDEHSPKNIERMRRGEPLKDAERAPWLASLGRRITDWLDRGRPTVLACSALTEASRRMLSGGDARIAFVHMTGSYELIRSRMTERSHFMPASLLRSQFETLEAPREAIALDAAEPPDVLVRKIRAALGV